MAEDASTVAQPPEPEPEPAQQPDAAAAAPPAAAPAAAAAASASAAAAGRKGGSAAVAKGQRVYVGNLSWGTSWQDLKDHMRTAGTVNFCNVMGANGRSKGCGLVEFATPEEAQHAIQTLHDSELDGRKIFCREDRENKPIGGGNHTGPRKRIHNPSNATRTRGPNGESIAGRQVFVGNLPWTATSIDLVENFGTCGTVVTAEVSQRSDGRSAGFGTVLFETEEAAANAISQFNHGEFDGRPMVVKLDAKAE